MLLILVITLPYAAAVAARLLDAALDVLLDILS